MAGLFSFMAAGALEGVGKGLIEEAKAQREERLREVERQAQRERDDRTHKQALERDRLNNSQQDARLERGFTHAETMEERRARREAGLPGDMRVDENGDLLVAPKSGGPYEPAKRADGTPVRPKQTTGSQTDIWRRTYLETEEALRKNPLNDLSDEEISRRAIEQADRAERAYSQRSTRTAGGGEPAKSGAAAPVGDTPPEGRAVPEQYPNARYSKQHDAFFVQGKDGKWAKVVEKPAAGSAASASAKPAAAPSEPVDRDSSDPKAREQKLERQRRAESDAAADAAAARRKKFHEAVRNDPILADLYRRRDAAMQKGGDGTAEEEAIARRTKEIEASIR